MGSGRRTPKVLWRRPSADTDDSVCNQYAAFEISIPTLRLLAGIAAKSPSPSDESITVPRDT
jgi:hypothetical protein